MNLFKTTHIFTSMAIKVTTHQHLTSHNLVNSSFWFSDLPVSGQ